MSSFSTGRLAPDAAGLVAAASGSPSPGQSPAFLSAIPSAIPSALAPAFQLHGLQWHRPDGQPLWQVPLQLSIGAERLGLVGRNGVGKSVLMRLLAGLAPPQGTASGVVQRHGRVHLVAPPLLPQDRRTVGEAMGLGPALAAVQRLEAGQATPDDLALADGQWDLPARIARALAEAGLPGLDAQTPVAGLSGGERMRVVLAGAMASDAHSILLDEPSNHLDADARSWLLHWLEDWPQATARTVVIASHDRQLLRSVDRIAELTPRGLALYGGDYALYRTQRDGEASAAQAALQHARTQRDATLARQQREREARQRRRARGRHVARTANLPAMAVNAQRETAEATAAREGQRDTSRRQLLDQAVRAAAERVQPSPPPLFVALPASRVPADKPVLEIEALRLPHVDGPPIGATLSGPLRIAVTGPNGCGKSTLLRVLAGVLPPRHGSASARVPTALLAQDGGDGLPPETSLLDWLRALDSPLSESALRTRLAQLRLDAPRVLQPMGVLSAGERLKAALAVCLWRAEPARLLLLDEPTNHLDLDTTLALQRALQGFEGALVVASHDAEFIDALKPTHRWEWREGRLVMRQSSMARAAGSHSCA